MQKADLHIHTTESDGLLSPKEVALWACKKNLKAISITDHDTINGIDEATSEAKKYDIIVVPGIELSTDYKGREIHVLGYYIDCHNEYLISILEKLKQSRYKRSIKMIERLNKIGINIDLTDVEKYQ